MTENPSIRIWLIDPISYTGMAYYDAGLCCALHSLGYDVTLVGSDGWLLMGYRFPFRRLDYFKGTHKARNRSRKGAAYALSLMRMLAAAVRERPSVVHWNYFEFAPLDYLAQRVLRRLGIGQVYTAHEILPWDSLRFNRSIFRRVYSTVDMILVHNEQDAEHLVNEFAVDRGRISVGLHGDYELFANPELPQEEARSRLGIPLGVPVALFFGSIRPSKGLEILLAAWIEVTRLVPEAHLVVVGKPYKGLDVSRYVSLVDRGGLQDQVSFRFEQVGVEETNYYYRAADLVVLPYHDIATSGVLRYAYSSGRSVVATAVGEHPLWVREGETGFLVPPGDPSALALRLVAVLKDRALAERLGRQGLRFGREKFSWDTIATGVVDAYARVSSFEQEG